jgi:hypothetical protein
MSRGSALQTSASSTPQTSRSGSRRVLKPVTEGAGLQSEPAVGDGHRYTARSGTLRSGDRLWPHRAAQNVRPHAASRTLFAAHHLVLVGAWFRHPLLGDGRYVGLAFARTGWLYPLFGPLIGWQGVALTGSDTSSTVLFGGLLVSCRRRCRRGYQLWRPGAVYLPQNSAEFAWFASDGRRYTGQRLARHPSPRTSGPWSRKPMTSKGDGPMTHY